MIQKKKIERNTSAARALTLMPPSDHAQRGARGRTDGRQGAVVGRSGAHLAMKRSQRVTFDLAYIGDFRSSDSTIAAVCDEISCAARAGYSVALCQYPSRDPRGGRTNDPGIRLSIVRGEATAVPPGDTRVSAKLAVLHEPLIPDLIGPSDLGFAADRAILVLHTPIADRQGAPRRDLSCLREAVQEATGAPPALAPAWPIVRTQLATAAASWSVLENDWQPVVDLGRWRVPRPADKGKVPSIGRYGAPERRFWPERFSELVRYYPLGDLVRVRLSSIHRELLKDLSQQCPSNWILFDHGTIALKRFLRFIHFYVPSFNRNWPLAPSVDILQALASGAVAVLPPQLASTFARGALYAGAGTASLECITRLHRDASDLKKQVAQGRELLHDRHDPQLYIERLQSLIGRPKSVPKCLRRPPLAQRQTSSGSDRRILFTATNGIGLGHLVQALAIAKRLPQGLKPVFSTMSQAISIVRACGYPAHYLPGERYLNARSDVWNAWLEHELAKLCDFHDARGLVYSGVWCYNGVLRAGARRSNLPMVWVRVPMWKRQIWDSSVQRAKYFDLVLDAGELAQARNVGARIPYEDRVAAVPPILLCDDGDLMTREEARRRLVLDPSEPAVLLQLGAGNNQALHPVIDHMLSVFERLGPIQVVIAEWLMADHVLSAWPGVKVLRDFPNAPYLPAFDFVVSASGYNTFHELMACGCPTVFVPSENQETDDQLGRARYAHEEGLGFCLRVSEIEGFEAIARRLLDPATRKRLREACRQRAFENGAGSAAQSIAALVESYGRGRSGPADARPA